MASRAWILFQIDFLHPSSPPTIVNHPDHCKSILLKIISQPQLIFVAHCVGVLCSSRRTIFYRERKIDWFKQLQLLILCKTLLIRNVCESTHIRTMLKKTIWSGRSSLIHSSLQSTKIQMSNSSGQFSFDNAQSRLEQSSCWSSPPHSNLTNLSNQSRIQTLTILIFTIHLCESKPAIHLFSFGKSMHSLQIHIILTEGSVSYIF